LDDGREFDVKYGIEDRENDLAFLLLDDVTETLPFIPMPDKVDIRVGDRVFLIGSSLGIENFNTVSDGIISSVSRNLYSRAGWEMYRKYEWQVMIQTTASAFGGNSGGPLFDMNGELLGVLVAGQAETLAFAVDARQIADKLDIVKLQLALCRFEELEQSQPEVQQWQTYEEYAENVGVL
jgi:S1-C subfamily serine protease